MTEKKFPDTELVEPEGFWPDDVVAHEPPDDLYDAARERQSRVTGPLSAPDDAGFESIRLGPGEFEDAEKHHADEQTGSFRFDPSTIENIGRPESHPASERPPVDPFEFLADANDHNAADEDPLTLTTSETTRFTPDRSQYISSLEMQFADDPVGAPDPEPVMAGEADQARERVASDDPPKVDQPRQDPVPFETYISGYTTQPLVEDAPAESTPTTDDSQPAAAWFSQPQHVAEVPPEQAPGSGEAHWYNQPPPDEEVFVVHTDEVPTQTWHKDPPPAAPDPFSADPYAPKLDEAWLGQTAPFDEPFDAAQFQAELTGETVRRSGLAWSAGIVFFSSVAFMLFLGWLVDLLLGTSPYGMVGGIIFGSVIGFIQFFRITSRIFSSKSHDPEIRSLMSPAMEETGPSQDPHTPPYPPESYPPA